ncbi:MazG nucleotide pyrophosphohydrolase domain-containing protein [Rhodococcus qingshengii]|nr:MazG nucleotide pyrophosphohydrolase domain-containing protein [Rhodococcus qingshengii]
MLKLQEEVGELTQAYLMMRGQSRYKGLSLVEIRERFDTELADVFTQVLLISRQYDVDLESVVIRRLTSWGHKFENEK